MAQLNSIVDMTELEAVNGMLAAIGEAPIDQTELDTPTRPDVTMAVNILRDTHRETLSMGWKFNMEFGFEIAPTGDSPFTWTFRDSTTESLNIFEPPADMIAFEVTKISAQQGSSYPDLVKRDPTQYSGSATKVFYNREKQQDGLNEDDYPYLYINYIRYVDFEDCPQVYKAYVAKAAGREFVEDTVGSKDLSRFSDKKVALTLRNLKREQGEQDDLNMLYNNAGSWAFLGQRPIKKLGVFEDRDSMKHQ